MSSPAEHVNSLSSIITNQISRLANQTSLLTPLTLPNNLPLAPINPLSSLLEHLTSTPVHEVYFPFIRFGVIHAVRSTTIWASLVKGKERRGVGRLGDLFGYLVLACSSLPSFLPFLTLILLSSSVISSWLVRLSPPSFPSSPLSCFPQADRGGMF